MFSFKSPASFCSASSAGSTTADDPDLDSPFDETGSNLLKEFQEAAAQLAELAETAKHEYIDDHNDKNCLETLKCHSLGWLPVDRSQLRKDAKNLLETSVTKVLNGKTGGPGGAGAGKPVIIGLYDEYLQLSMDGLSDLKIPRRNLKVWSVYKDHLCIIYKHMGSLECHIFADENACMLKDFCDLLNILINTTTLSKAVSMTSLVDERASDSTFVVECDFCGSSTISNDEKSDISAVHRIIYSLQTSADHVPAKCAISLSSITVSNEASDVDSIFKCRLRYISFLSLGIDPRFIGIVSMLGPLATCFVLKIQPNASRVSSILQENITLRYQKALEAKKIIDRNAQTKDATMLTSIVDMTPPNTLTYKSQPQQVSRWKSLISIIKKS